MANLLVNFNQVQKRLDLSGYCKHKLLFGFSIILFSESHNSHFCAMAYSTLCFWGYLCETTAISNWIVRFWRHLAVFAVTTRCIDHEKNFAKLEGLLFEVMSIGIAMGFVFKSLDTSREHWLTTAIVSGIGGRLMYSSTSVITLLLFHLSVGSMQDTDIVYLCWVSIVSPLIYIGVSPWPDHVV